MLCLVPADGLDKGPVAKVRIFPENRSVFRDFSRQVEGVGRAFLSL